MGVTVEKKDGNMAVLTIEVPSLKLTEAIEMVYRRQRNSIQVPGFRRGKASRKVVEKIYGKDVFYKDASDILLRETYRDAALESGEDIVSPPQIEIIQAEEGKPFIYRASVALKPEVTLGKYKGVEIPRNNVIVTDEEINSYIDRERNENARDEDIDNRPVMSGDRIKLDFDGTVDEAPFEGGKASDFELIIGSNSFIPEFENQIIGKSIGEEFDVNVTFPDDYHDESVRGKDAVFKCRVRSISVRELPELDEDFVGDVCEDENVKTVEEYKSYVADKIREEKEEKAKKVRENEAVSAAVKNARMDIPDAMVREQAERIVDEFEQGIRSRGMSFEKYLHYAGTTRDTLVNQSKPQAVSRIQNSLVLEAIARAENIAITDEMFDEEVSKMADSYRMEKDKLLEMMDNSSIKQVREDLAIREAVKIIADNAVEVDMPGVDDAREEDGTNEQVGAQE